MNQIKNNLSEIKNNIKNYLNHSNKFMESDIMILAVTKNVDIEPILESIGYGVTDVGENKPQELKRKYDIIGDKVRWHLIGSLQTNKVKYVINCAYMIHSLDRLSLCEEIQKRAEKEINCLVQVNISNEETKQGLKEEEVISFIKEVSKRFNKIKIKGLMTMAPFTDDEDIKRSVFKGLNKLSRKIQNENIENVSMDYLSMGMSNDYQIALEEGSNIVRIGTSIFGKRK
ncbi:MAG: YggS family pyridoxal phosphate-dependent enzyme [Peptostreptococcaceae bacterium]